MFQRCSEWNICGINEMRLEIYKLEILTILWNLLFRVFKGTNDKNISIQKREKPQIDFRLIRIDRSNKEEVLTQDDMAASTVWIACESIVTNTMSLVIKNCAMSIGPTCSITRAHAFITSTSQRCWTIRIHYTFWSTIWWSSDIIRQTRANGLIIMRSTYWIWTTWISIAWV